MKNRKGTEWTIWKLISLFMLVLVLALVIYGISTGAFSPLIKKVEAAFNSVLGLIKPTSENPDLIRDAVINGIRVKILLDDGNGRCIIKEVRGDEKYKKDYSYILKYGMEGGKLGWLRPADSVWELFKDYEIASDAQIKDRDEIDRLQAAKKKLIEDIRKGVEDSKTGPVSLINPNFLDFKDGGIAFTYPFIENNRDTYISFYFDGGNIKPFRGFESYKLSEETQLAIKKFFNEKLAQNNLELKVNTDGYVIISFVNGINSIVQVELDEGCDVNSDGKLEHYPYTIIYLGKDGKYHLATFCYKSNGVYIYRYAYDDNYWSWMKFWKNVNDDLMKACYGR